MTRVTWAIMCVCFSAFTGQFAEASSIYAANAASGTLYRIDAGGVGTPMVTGLTNPSALAVSPDGGVYVRTTVTSDINSDFQVLRVEPSGATSVIVPDYPNLTTRVRGQFTNGLAVDKHGDLFIANPAHLVDTQFPPPGPLPFGIVEITPGGVVTTVAPKVQNVVSIAVDMHDQLYASTENTPGGSAAGTYRIPTGDSPVPIHQFIFSSLAAASDGALFAQNLATTLLRISSDDVVTAFGPSDPIGQLAVDPSGNVYTAERAFLKKVAANGATSSIFFNTPVDSVATVVPEPGGLQLFTLGSVVVLAMRLRLRIRQIGRK